MPVTLRSQALKNKYHLFLDITGYGKRKKEYLKIYTVKDYTTNMKFSTNGKPKVKFVNDTDKLSFELAWKLRGQKEYELNLQQSDFFRQSSEKESFIDYFKAQLSIKKNSTYDAAYYRLRTFCNGKLRYKDVDLDFLKKFKASLVNDDTLSNNTINTYLNRFKIIWKESIKDGKTERNPFISLIIPKRIQTEKTYLNLKEVQKIAQLKMDKDRDNVVRKAFLFCCFTGLRFSDIRQLSWDNINDDVLVFRQKKSKTKVIRIPIHTTAQKILQSMEQNQERVFPYFSNAEANITIKKIALFADIDKHLTFHTSRHSCATILYESGVDMPMISKMLGHSGIDMTKIYTHLADSKMREAVNKIDDIDIKL